MLYYFASKHDRSRGENLQRGGGSALTNKPSRVERPGQTFPKRTLERLPEIRIRAGNVKETSKCIVFMEFGANL